MLFRQAFLYRCLSLACSHVGLVSKIAIEFKSKGYSEKMSNKFIKLAEADQSCV